jgi:hypothetical protein
MDIQMHPPGIVTVCDGSRSLRRTRSSSFSRGRLSVSKIVFRNPTLGVAGCGQDRRCRLRRSSCLRNFSFETRCGFEVGSRSRLKGGGQTTPDTEIHIIGGLKP